MLFAIAAGLALLVAMSLFVDVGERTSSGLLSTIQGVATTALLLIGVVGLNRDTPWARPFALVLLVLMATDGALRFGVAVVDGRIDMPFLGIAALVVLGLHRGPLTRSDMTGRDRRTLAVLSAAAIVGWLWGAILGPLATGPNLG